MKRRHRPMKRKHPKRYAVISKVSKLHFVDITRYTWKASILMTKHAAQDLKAKLEKEYFGKFKVIKYEKNKKLTLKNKRYERK